jgi:hypothetical protein
MYKTIRHRIVDYFLKIYKISMHTYRYKLCVEGDGLRDVIATYGVDGTKTTSNNILEVSPFFLPPVNKIHLEFKFSKSGM